MKDNLKPKGKIENEWCRYCPYQRFTKILIRSCLKVWRCGHIHYPKLTDDYMNSGDFCENTTCLVEDFNGKWKIISI
jgi:hypothetical protein